MSRHWGITSGTGRGGHDSQSRSLAPGAQRDSNSDDRELAARLFVGCFFGFPSLFCLAVYLLLFD